MRRKKKPYRWADVLLEHLGEILLDKKNKKGVRMQKTRFLIHRLGETYTFTIERGDKLNKTK
jgi:hypothetical protein